MAANPAVELTFIITSLPNNDSRSLKDVPETDIKDNTGMDTVPLFFFWHVIDANSL